MSEALKIQSSEQAYQKVITSHEDTLAMLDGFFKDERVRWNNFFANLKADHPLSTQLPAESLVTYLRDNKIKAGNALDIGCGNGRDSIFLAQHGFRVDALDISDEAVTLTSRNAKEKGVTVQAHRCALFDFDVEAASYDLVHDSGLLHHLFPHRRPQYIDYVSRALKTGGFLSLVLFNEKMGTTANDWELYEKRSMEGGMSYPLDKLTTCLGQKFKLIEYRDMKNYSAHDQVFGHDFLAASLWRKI